VTVSHQHLEEFLAVLVYHDYELIMNLNKHMILAVKKNFKIRDEMDLREIPIMIPEYCYLGVNMDISQADFTLTWKRSINDLITNVLTCGTILKIFPLRINACCGQHT
jgi:hypothetical protein